MESSIEISQTGGTSNPKPSLAPKPRLTPKPFSLQKNTAIRSIHAPKRTAATSKTTTQQTGKLEASGVPKPSVSNPALKLPQQTNTSDSKPSSISVLTKDKPKPTKESKECPYGEDTLDSSVGKSDPASQTTPPKETPKSEPIQRDDVIHANHKASTDIINSEQIDGKKTEDITQTSVVQMVEESGSDVSSTDNPAYQWGSSRKRLSMKLTSKFESAGLSPPPQPSVTVATTSTKDEAHKPESSDPKPNQTTSGPSNDEGALKEAYSGGGSIKRRISLLFDSSSRPEAMTKREEPEILNGTGSVKGVKERIKTWATEIIPEGPKTEKKPQFAPRTRSKSFEPATSPTAEKTTKVPPEPSTQTSAIPAVDLPLKVSPAEQSTETPMETSKDGLADVKPSENLRETLRERLQNKSTEGGVKRRNPSSSTTHTGTDEGDSAESEIAQHAPKRNDVKRRSVRFGIVERDDGGPPLILGSASDSSEEEEEEDTSGDEAEEDIPVSVPVYKRVRGLQKKDDDEVREQEKERLKHLEFEKRRRAKENEQAGLKLEEERKQKEEEREKEKARQREDEERERERLKEEEMERQRMEEYEQEVLKEQERERQRLREEEMERERQLELMWQRQREEERERGTQKEGRLKQDQEEREKERMKEEARKEERQLPREDKERLIHSEEHRLEGKLREKEINRIKQREEEWENDWVKKTKMQRGEEGERDRENELDLIWQRQKEEDRERATQKEERLRQEEREKERLRMEAEERERERQRMLTVQQEVKEEMERKRQIEMERQKEEDRERVRQKEERLRQERLRQEEREKERLRMEAEEREMERQRMLKEQQEKEEIETMRQIEMEKLKEEDREKARQKEERLRQEERETERLRMEVEERERERQRMLKEQQEKEELERMRQIEMEKRKEEDRERARQREERLRQEERETERLRMELEERERERQRMLKELQKKEEELERMRQIDMERQKEEGRREEERNRQVEKERVEELERKLREELDRKRAQQLEEELRMEDERKREERESMGLNLISIDSEDVPQKSKSLFSPSVKAYETSDSQVEVVYDDFSVRAPLLKVDFDDFSVKPKRWGSQAKVETTPQIQSWPAVSLDKEEVEMLAPLDVITCKNKVPEQVEKPGSPKSTLAQERPEEEQVISLELVEREEEETQREEDEATMEDEVDEEDEQEAPVNSYSTNDEDTDALIDSEPDQQNEACEQTSEIDSPKPVPDQVPEVPSEDVDTTDFCREPELAQFPESSTPLLDTSVQKSKADLVRRRTRSHQPRSLRGGLAPKESPDWRTRDSTDEKEASSKQRESDSDEDQPKAKIVCSPPPTSQRVPMFPGLSPAALMAQLKKRTGGGEIRGRKETEEDKGREEKESQNEEGAPSPSQRSRSTRSAAHLAGAARVLPPLGSTDAGGNSSPAWLKELKSKKRLSQYDSEA